MRRMQVQFTDEQAAFLESRAAATAKPVSAVVRDVVEAERAGDERRRRFDVALAVVGMYESGLTDLAENHDAYFVRAIEERIG